MDLNELIMIQICVCFPRVLVGIVPANVFFCLVFAEAQIVIITLWVLYN